MYASEAMCDADAYLMPSHCLAKFSEFNMLEQDYADFGDRADEMDTETAHKAARSATTKKRNKHALIRLDLWEGVFSRFPRMEVT